MSTEKVNLSEATEFVLRNGVVIRVYPASLETYSLLAPKLKDMQQMAKLDESRQDLNKQADMWVDIVYELIKDDNDIKKDALKKAVSLEACVRIMQKALGTFGAMSPLTN